MVALNLESWYMESRIFIPWQVAYVDKLNLYKYMVKLSLECKCTGKLTL